MLRNIPGERRPQLHRITSLKSRKCLGLFHMYIHIYIYTHTLKMYKCSAFFLGAGVALDNGGTAFRFPTLARHFCIIVTAQVSSGDDILAFP
jgi:hypothetical protein